jgi:hypothetical protein
MWNELEERTSFTHSSVRLSSVASLPGPTFNKSDSSRVRRIRSATSPPRVWQRVTLANREFSCLSIDSLSVFYSTGKEHLGGRLKRCDRRSNLSTRRIVNTNTIYRSQRRDLELGSRRPSTKHESVTLGGCESFRLTGFCLTPDFTVSPLPMKYTSHKYSYRFCGLQTITRTAHWKQML